MYVCMHVYIYIYIHTNVNELVHEFAQKKFTV